MLLLFYDYDYQPVFLKLITISWPENKYSVKK